MRKTTISVTPSGVAHTRGDSLAQKLFPRKKHAKMIMQRITEIKYSTEAGFFYIEWLRGPLASMFDSPTHTLDGHNMYAGDIDDSQIPVKMQILHMSDDFHIPVFKSYRSAVKYEVWFISEMRKQGVVFD